MFADPHLNNIGFPHYYALGITFVCAITDIRTARIYNVITYPSILVGLAFNALVGGQAGILSSVVGLVVGIVPFGFAAWRGWIGAGDVKLFGAIGAIAGFFILLDVLTVSFAIAAIFGFSSLLIRHGVTGTARRFASGVRMLVRGTAAEDTPELAGPRLRLGLFVFVGTVIAVAGVWLRP